MSGVARLHVSGREGEGVHSHRSQWHSMWHSVLVTVGVVNHRYELRRDATPWSVERGMVRRVDGTNAAHAASRILGISICVHYFGFFASRSGRGAGPGSLVTLK